MGGCTAGALADRKCVVLVPRRHRVKFTDSGNTLRNAFYGTIRPFRRTYLKASPCAPGASEGHSGAFGLFPKGGFGDYIFVLERQVYMHNGRNASRMSSAIQLGIQNEIRKFIYRHCYHNSVFRVSLRGHRRVDLEHRLHIVVSDGYGHAEYFDQQPH